MAGLCNCFKFLKCIFCEIDYFLLLLDIRNRCRFLQKMYFGKFVNIKVLESSPHLFFIIGRVGLVCDNGDYYYIKSLLRFLNNQIP